MSELFLIFEMNGHGFYLVCLWCVVRIVNIIIFKSSFKKKEIKRKLKYLTEKNDGFEE